jgi:dipeptidyl aminopeptidase/acylaminoacyl peptidase
MKNSIAVCGLLVAASLAKPSAQTAPRPVELADYYRIESVGGAAISPDGRTVAFVRTFVIESENRRHSEVWTVASDGASPPRRLTSPSFSSSAPRWSPDGRLLAFSSRRRVNEPSGQDDESIWFLRMDEPGGEAFAIPGVEGTPIFSPDNQWIAFTRSVRPPARPVPERSEFEKKTDERFKGKIYDWMNARFDGRGYLPDPRDPQATPPEELFIVPRSGGTPKQLTSLGVNVQAPSWRADGAALAFVADLSQRDEHTYERADIFTVDLSGTVARLTDDGYDHGSPVWAPDGSIVAVREQSLNQVIASKQPFGSPTDLYRFTTDRRPPVNLTPSWDLIPGAPRMAPEGRFIYFTAGTAGSTHLFRMPVSGGAVEQITSGERRLSDLSIAWAAGRMAYAAGDLTQPASIRIAQVDGSGERRLTSFNDRWLSAVRVRPVERVQFSSKDGTPIDGWLILPEGASASARVPLILNIHGGPHGAYGNDFSLPFQLQAAQGYAVLYTNPRGSTEYGEKFLWATWGGWGAKDYDDVMAGVDFIVQRYPIDPKRLGVTGYSYGGFLTNWIITQTTRFSAAIVGAGISNWISDYGTADIPRTKESEFGGMPWDRIGAETMLKWSPVMHAGSVATPTLFVHGESDLRVPIEQGEQMYTALQKRKVPAKFIRYPDSYHGGWTPWNTVHRYQHELQWWKTHLSGAAARTTSQQRDR